MRPRGSPLGRIGAMAALTHRTRPTMAENGVSRVGANE